MFSFRGYFNIINSPSGSIGFGFASKMGTDLKITGEAIGKVVLIVAVALAVLSDFMNPEYTFIQKINYASIDAMIVIATYYLVGILFAVNPLLGIGVFIVIIFVTEVLDYDMTFKQWLSDAWGWGD